MSDTQKPEITLDQYIEQLEVLRSRYPYLGDLPVYCGLTEGGDDVFPLNPECVGLVYLEDYLLDPNKPLPDNKITENSIKVFCIS